MVVENVERKKLSTELQKEGKSRTQLEAAEQSFRSSFRETKASMEHALKFGCDV